MNVFTGVEASDFSNFVTYSGYVQHFLNRLVATSVIHAQNGPFELYAGLFGDDREIVLYVVTDKVRNIVENDVPGAYL